MSPRVSRLVLWTPRVFGLVVTGFIALFALDSFEGKPILQALPGFAVHLIPSALVGLMTAVGWRYRWAGAAIALALAATYAAMVPHRPDWILVISGPLVVVAALFALSASLERRPPPRLT